LPVGVDAGGCFFLKGNLQDMLVNLLASIAVPISLLLVSAILMFSCPDT